MDIISRLINNGEQIGVYAKDGTETYALPMEALKSEFYHDLLKTSGYKLTEVTKPEYNRNGVDISDLPEMDFNSLNDDDMMGFFNAKDLYPPMPISDLYKLVERSESFEKFREGMYTIHTREEFIKYLDSIKNGVSSDDFMPINYFVAPSARFSAAEYLSGSIANYISIMSNRRVFSRARFNHFVNWLINDKGNANPTPDDVIDAYFSFGFDGVNLAVTAKIEDITTVNPRAPKGKNNGEQSAEIADMVDMLVSFHDTDVALLSSNRDAFEGLLFVENENNIIPESVRRNTTFAKSLSADFYSRHSVLGPNEYIPEAFYIKRSYKVRTWVCVDTETNEQFKIIISPLDVLTRSSSNTGAGVLNSFGPCTPDNFSKIQTPSKWFVRDSSYENDVAILKQVAAEMCSKTLVPCSDTSFNILLRMGVTPGCAVRYILSNYNAIDNPQIVNSDDPADEMYGMPNEEDFVLTEKDIETYFSSGMKADELSDTEYTIYVDSNNNGISASIGHGAPIGIVRYGTCTAARKAAVIEEIMNGTRDLGNISEGHQVDASMDTDTVFYGLYAAHFILGMRIDQIVSACSEFQPDKTLVLDTASTPFSLTFNGKTIHIEVPNRNNAKRAADAEALNHLIRQITDADTFYYVMDVAREMTNTSADGEQAPNRHVGVYGVAFDRYTYKLDSMGCSVGRVEYKNAKVPTVGGYVEKFAEQYYTMLATNAPNGLRSDEQRRARIDSIRAAQLFMCDIALYGQVANFTKYPAEWASLTAEDVETIKGLSRRFVDSTLSICERLIEKTGDIITDKQSNTDFFKFAWRSYCVNATVTPISVTPTDCHLITETDLAALYRISEVSAADAPSVFARLNDGLHAFNPNYFKNASDSWRYVSNPLCKVPTLIDMGFESLVEESELVYGEYSSAIDDDFEANLKRIDTKYCNEPGAFWRDAVGCLHRYFLTSISERKSHESAGEFFMFSTHPADVLYPNAYGKFDPLVRPAKEGDKTYYPCHPGLMLHGPDYKRATENEKIIGREFREGFGAKRIASGFGVTAPKTTIVAVKGFYAEDLIACSNLFTCEFTGQKFFVNGSKVGFDNGVHDVAEVMSLPEGSYAIKKVTGNIAYICDVNNIIYRIKL